MSLLSRVDSPSTLLHDLGKTAAEQEVSYDLVGQLQSSQNRIIVSVPNQWVRGYFSMIGEHGIELPTVDGIFNAGIEVITADELQSLGGPDRITERGKQYAFSTGRLFVTEPGWPDISKLWFVRIHSRELQLLRRSYGLSSLPSDAAFKVCVAVRRRGVLGRNDTGKES